MACVEIPDDYKPVFNLQETQRAISYIKNSFCACLSAALNLTRVSAPLFVNAGLGLNDDLNGSEKPVAFFIPAFHQEAQVVQSLAKWKRFALKRYGFGVESGLITDMNAIRPAEIPDRLHSIYVDQWDWEKVILKENRNLQYLKETVRIIVDSICQTSERLRSHFPQAPALPDEPVAFITAQALEDCYPNCTPQEREIRFVRDHKITCVLQIGHKLRSGQPHDGRAPDYDDWQLNCDLLFWSNVLNNPIEISSMGIRVDPSVLDCQLTISGCDQRRNLPFHKMLLSGELPDTIGGGIGQSRLCMLLLGCVHIGQVQASIWDQETIDTYEKKGIVLL